MSRIKRRAVCLSHALTWDHVSTISIEGRRQEQGVAWADPDDVSVGLIDWLKFPVVPPDGSEPLEVQFKIIPLMGFEFNNAPKAKSYAWVERAVLQIVGEARRDGVEMLTIGLGAYVKRATNHGLKLIERHPELEGYVCFNHGDIGTVGLTLQMIREAELPKGFSVGVVGATGPMGGLIAKMLPEFNPSRIILIGKSADDPRLTSLRDQIDLSDGDIVLSQDENDCRAYQCSLVVVATNGHIFPPTATEEGTLVLDVSAPNACREDPGWEGRLVYLAGCGQFDLYALPEYFGSYGGVRVLRVVGEDGEFWGCMGQAVYDCLFNVRRHLVGPELDSSELAACAERFARVNYYPQRRNMFGNIISADEERYFVERMMLPSLLPLAVGKK